MASHGGGQLDNNGNGTFSSANIVAGCSIVPYYSGNSGDIPLAIVSIDFANHSFTVSGTKNKHIDWVILRPTP
ncbi:MAG TPA: hypothetical protein VKH35_08425 [Thermoanaerobaculia bacterium]|nr:hypothetical protein [Thermoanaerobaculia bacterium]